MRFVPCCSPLILLVGWVLTTSAWAGVELEVTDAWVREAPPNARVMAGYLQVSNPGSDTIRITSADSPQLGSIELHTTVVKDGAARMVHLDEVELAPGQTVRFEPGGMHLMLFDPKQPLREGDTVTIWLVDSNGNRHPIEAPVRKAEGGSGDHHHH